MAKKAAGQTEAETGAQSEGKSARPSSAKKTTAKKAPAKKAAPKSGGKSAGRSSTGGAAKKSSKAASGSATTFAGVELPNLEVPGALKDFGAQLAKMMDTDVGRVILAEILVQTAKALSRTAAARDAMIRTPAEGVGRDSRRLGLKIV